jgi:hypothetical protein
MDKTTLSALARRLGSVIEPVAAQVYFSPECHANYVALGFDPSKRNANGVALPDGPAYFTSRGSLLGQVPGDLVAAAFGVFNPEIVVPMVAVGWTKTDAPTIFTARDDGAIAQLLRLLGAEPVGLARVNELLDHALEPLRPEGRALYSGLRSQAIPSSPLGAMWRKTDLLREFRGDSHIAAWVSAGVDATEICMMTELYWGMPLRSYSRTRAWTDAQFDAAHDRLRARGLVDDVGLTEPGRVLREDIESRTDRQMRPAIDALGDDIDELFTLMAPWGTTIREGFGYLASGPHDLAAAAKA